MAVSDANPAVLHDTLGGEYGLDCTSLINCPLTELEGTPAAVTCGYAEYGDQFRLFWGNRLALVCLFAMSSPDSGAMSAEFCRPVACGDREDCPVGLACTRGLCQIPGRVTDLDDAIALCLADAPWLEDCDDYLDYFFDLPNYEQLTELVDSCEDSDDPCSVPSECRQP